MEELTTSSADATIPIRSDDIIARRPVGPIRSMSRKILRSLMHDAYHGTRPSPVLRGCGYARLSPGLGTYTRLVRGDRLRANWPAARVDMAKIRSGAC